VCTYGSSAESGGNKVVSQTQVPIFYPLREVFKNELKTYLHLRPSVRDLMPTDISAAASVVSHKDLSIAEVMERYFDSVEGPYSGIVANVVRTTGKLNKAASKRFCHMCGMTLDEQGDSRWAGELGDDIDIADASSTAASLCYGCKRSISG
jgi:cytoplasmic tRNA 2-thiolation protein 2